MKYDVFISYSSHDQKVVEGLCGHLESRGIRCFVAYRDIPRGVVWADAIVEALDESRMMVVVFSENFNNSAQVNREIELACEDGKHILTYRLSDTAFRGAKKYYLKNLNWIDAFPDPEQTFGSVADGVAKLLGLKLKKVVEAEEETLLVPAPQPIPTPAPVPAPVPMSNPVPAPKPTKKPYSKYLWALALMSLVLISLWLGIDSYQERKRYIAQEKVRQERIAQEKAETERIAQMDGNGYDGVYQVGDYYNRNGKEGVVFEVSADGRHGKIVSLKQTTEELQWCSNEEFERKIKTGASDESNGMNNQRKIQQINGWREKYPAFKWCADQGEGWYLPALEELESFENNTVADAVTRTLEIKGENIILSETGWYWSSTEYDGFRAWLVCPEFGIKHNHDKNLVNYVRAVSAF